mmetsp:Transcript_51558/g.120973  ORF Transcript_51558/g.120973 Transcript_51558/m.120973 type:complete len:280 (+) Transcript_51558:172-1011(+)
MSCNLSSRNGLVRNLSAPASSMTRCSSSNTLPDTARIGSRCLSGCVASHSRYRRVASTPSITGMFTSIKQRSNSCFMRMSKASWPSEAMVVVCPSRTSAAWLSLRINALSSTTRTLMGLRRRRGDVDGGVGLPRPAAAAGDTRRFRLDAEGMRQGEGGGRGDVNGRGNGEPLPLPLALRGRGLGNGKETPTKLLNGLRAAGESGDRIPSAFKVDCFSSSLGMTTCTGVAVRGRERVKEHLVPCPGRDQISSCPPRLDTVWSTMKRPMPDPPPWFASARW